MQTYLLTATGPQGYKLTPRATAKAEDEIRRTKAAGFWLVEHSRGSYALHATADGWNLRWRSQVSPDIRCPHCNARLVETAGPLDNERLGAYACRSCAEYGHPSPVEDDGIDWNRALADLHARAEKMRPATTSTTQTTVRQEAANSSNIELSESTKEVLRRSARLARDNPNNERLGYTTVTMAYNSNAERLQALANLGGMASDKALRAEIARMRSI